MNKSNSNKKNLKDMFADEYFRNYYLSQLLESEKTRIRFLFYFFVVTFFASILVTFLFSETISKIRKDSLPTYIMSVFLFIISIYYFLILKRVEKIGKANKKIPPFVRALNAIIEASIPTSILFIIGSNSAFPAGILFSPPEFLYFIFIILTTLRLDPILSLITGSIAGIEYYFLSKYMIGISNNIESLPVIFDSFIYIAKSFVIFLSGIVSSFVSVQIVLRIQNSYNFLEERNRISDLFGKHVSPIVVDKLLNQKNDFETEVRHVCMMFFDIRNFTSFSENKDPVEVVNYLNCLFDFIIDIINKNNGIVNKFLGDGFMAVFGAPISGEDDVKNAIQSSFEILERIKLETIKGNIPATTVGIGLHAGKAVTGNVGSATRKEYTIIGDVVNLASRIEQLNKKYATQILVSEDVWKLYDKKKGEFLDEVDIRGREEKVKIYKLY